MKPILFNTEMVKAVSNDLKTVTRRVVKPQPKYQLRIHDEGYHKGEWHEYSENPMADKWCNRPWGSKYTPPYHPGDILYVRETWNTNPLHDFGDEPNKYVYKADYDGHAGEFGWHPSIHMPKEAARLFQRVTGVRVERLQDITENGVCEEGAEPLIGCQSEHSIYYPDGGMETCYNVLNCPNCPIDKSYPELFGQQVWNSTIKPADLPLYGWDANPWVWVIKFERISKEEAIKEDKQ